MSKDSAPNRTDAPGPSGGPMHSNRERWLQLALVAVCAALEEVATAWAAQLERRPSSGEILLVNAGAPDSIGEMGEALNSSLAAFSVEPDRIAGHIHNVMQRSACLFAVAVPDQVA